MAMAIALSVTVSMAAVTIGTLRVMLRENCVFNSTSLGSWNEQDVVKGQAVHRYFICNK